MADTKINAGWKEGSGALGAQGRNSLPGESCYAWRAFPDIPWESDSGVPVPDLGSSKLWKSPVADLRNLQWQEGNWVEIKVDAIEMLNKARISKIPVFTLGLWGTSGNGYYAINSRESGHEPELVLTLEESKDGALSK
jgi:hypothetical protein